MPFKDVVSLERCIKSLSETHHLNRYALIVHDHDKDIEDEGKTAKEHVHVILEFTERVSVTSVAKFLDDSPQQFEIMTKKGGIAPKLVLKILLCI